MSKSEKDIDEIPYAEEASESGGGSVYNECEYPYVTSQRQAYHYIQPSNIISTNLGVIDSGNQSTFCFSCVSDNPISDIVVKGNGLILNVETGCIRSNVPVLLNYSVGKLRVWNAEYKEEYSLLTTGKSVLSGMNVLNFDGKRVKVDKKFMVTNWKVDITNLKSFVVNGKSNNVSLNNLKYNNLCDIFVHSDKNKLNINGGVFGSLNLSCYYGDVTMSGCSCEYMNCALTGNGFINHLNSEKISINITGGGVVYVDDLDTVVTENIYGLGKVIKLEKKWMNGIYTHAVLIQKHWQIF